MEIYLVRHTTPDIDKGICYGQSDLDLAPNHNKEITRTCSLLPHDIDEVFSSPLVRCQQLSNRISNESILDTRLMELNFGDWELEPWNAIDSNDLNKWMSNYVKQSPPNSESFLELSSRVNSFFDEICNRDLSKTAIICHAGVIRAILSNVLKLNLEDSFKIQLDYGSITQINKIHDSFQLVYTNRV